MTPTVILLLWCVAALLGAALLAVAIGRSETATSAIYGATLAASGTACILAATRLAGDPVAASVLTLPLGLPWLGAQFRLDPLAAFFLLVVNLG
ncbi:MAG: hydrogenase 4 subunit B, partial [Pseudomonadota bacterium]